MMTETLKFIVLISAVTLDSPSSGNTLCAFSKKDNVQYKKHESALEDESTHTHSIAEHNVDANTTEHCSKDSDACYALWQEDPINRTIVIITQGCWDSSGAANCGQSDCIANKKPAKALTNSKFCCCSGNLCNLNVTDSYLATPHDPVEELNPALQYVEPTGYSSSTVVVISVAAMTAVIVVLLIIYYLFRFHYHPPKRSRESLHLMESCPPPAPAFDFDSLKIQETIGRGRYGTVCRGTLHDQSVAVKIFTHQNKQYFLNERYIYTLPNMEHESILKYIGSEERLGQDGRPEYLLILSFSPIGCLQDFLRNETVDWTQLCKMVLSIARGLAHLHTEFGKSEKLKPCVAHRDLTSRNILMKTGNSCMLCDFGFAIRISGSKYYQNGEEQIAETTSLADVGTPRYMAPEILEGAVNLRDCESSLKQIDVYSLGLVMWEIATRCSDLYQGIEVPEYKLPFEAEVGIHPTMEQMQVLVTRHKARPLFPDLWKDSNPAVRTLKETIEECWDQDAEARLTTLCVEERLAELPVIWERYKAGLSISCCATPTTLNPLSNQRMTLSLNKIQNASDITSSETFSNEEIPSFPRERAHSLSEGTTETILSPSEPGGKDLTPVNNEKNAVTNNIIASSKVTMPLQPYQGRNPCLEQNLMLGPLEEDVISGNILLAHPLKPTVDRNYHSYSDGDTNIFDLSRLDNSSLVSNDLLSHSTQISNPVHYIQTKNHLLATPKQFIAPSTDQLSEHSDQFSKDESQWRQMNFIDCKKKAKEGIKAGLRNLLDRKPMINSKEMTEETQPLKGFSGSACSPDTISESTFDQSSNVNCNWTSDDGEDQVIDTEVRVVKSDCSSTVVRPINNAQITSTEDCMETTDYADKKTIRGGFPPAQHIKADADVRREKQLTGSDANSVIKNKRPNSLPLQDLRSFVDNGENMEKSDGEVSFEGPASEQKAAVQIRRKNSNRKRKGVKRVKTPFEIKGRFSLYDDRIMSSQELSAAYSKETIQPILYIGETTKFSTSVPLNMNTLCSSKLTNSMRNAESIESENNKSKNEMIAPGSVNQLQIIHSSCDI